MTTFKQEDIISVNGEDYVRRSVVDALQPDTEAIWKNLTLQVMDNVHVVGLGSATLSDHWQAVKISTEMLTKALAILKPLNLEGITLAIKTDKPLWIGTLKDNTISGVVIAPRVPNDT